MTLDETVTLIEAYRTRPCFCEHCQRASRIAKDALIALSPTGVRLMEMSPDDPAFKPLENKFRANELTRLSTVLVHLQSIHCKMRNTPEQRQPALPSRQSPTSDGARKFMQAYRQRVIEYRKNPRVPGSYVIK